MSKVIRWFMALFGVKGRSVVRSQDVAIYWDGDGSVLATAPSSLVYSRESGSSEQVDDADEQRWTMMIDRRGFLREV